MKSSLVVPMLALLAACGPGGEEGPVEANYVLGSVVDSPEGRTTYFQAVATLDGPFTNEGAVEAAGNGVLLAQGRDVFLGLAESPEWVKYSYGDDNVIAESGRMSLAGEGFSFVDYGNALVAEDLAVSVSTEALVAVVWNPKTMTIVQTIDLPHLQRDGFSVEAWTTVAEDGLVYIPARWANWDEGAIYPVVQTTVLDPRTGEIVAIAEDDRCASGGRSVRGSDGARYVIGDGRNYSIHMFANAAGEEAPPSCLLRLPEGATDFDPDYAVEIKSLTGGFESVTELESLGSGSDVAFGWVFREDLLPEGVEPIDFAFWSHPVFELWKFELGDTPSAAPVTGFPPSVLGFDGAVVNGKVYEGLGDTEQTVVYELDETGTAKEKFTMDGYFYGLWAVD